MKNKEEDLPGVLGNKGTLAKYRGEQGNMNLFLGNRGTKLYKLGDENKVSKFIKGGTNKENVWEDGNIGQFWKEQGSKVTLLRDPQRNKQTKTKREKKENIR